MINDVKHIHLLTHSLKQLRQYQKIYVYLGLVFIAFIINVHQI